MIEPSSKDAACGAPPGSLEAIYLARESALLRYARRLVADDDSAQDVVQEAFMRLHAEFDQVRQPEAWLYRTVHNLALNQRRAGRKIVPLDPQGQAEHDPADPAPLPDEQIERLEAIGQTRLCLAVLDDRRRELVRLKFEENLSYQEISLRTNLGIGNVGFLLHHALKDLAQALRKAGVVS